jgi:hypothetical protein
MHPGAVDVLIGGAAVAVADPAVAMVDIAREAIGERVGDQRSRRIDGVSRAVVGAIVEADGRLVLERRQLRVEDQRANVGVLVSGRAGWAIQQLDGADVDEIAPLKAREAPIDVVDDITRVRRRPRPCENVIFLICR